MKPEQPTLLLPQCGLSSKGPKEESLTSGVVLFQPSKRNWFAASLLIQSELDNEILELG